MLEQVLGVNDGIDLLLERYGSRHDFPLERGWIISGLSSLR
jgi:hypothetical protein